MDEIVTPLPKPETTPPVTTMYFIFLVVVGDGGIIYRILYIWFMSCMVDRDVCRLMVQILSIG